MHKRMELALEALEAGGGLRHLPSLKGAGKPLVNLASNDYLGLASNASLQQEFLRTLEDEPPLFSASSSRLLTGNVPAYEVLETTLARLFGTQSALVFNSGYHMNVGILPALCTDKTLILADKLVHASLIDGIRLSRGKFLRYAHNDLNHLETLLRTHHEAYEHVIVVTESIFSMDGDEADLKGLVALKHRYEKVMLYVDEAHGVGVRGESGLGCAQGCGCMGEIDILAGTFGKALASVGGYIACSALMREFLVNHMRTLIFTTALPPINLLWSAFVLERLSGFEKERAQLAKVSVLLREGLVQKGYAHPSSSHIIPFMVGENTPTLEKARVLQALGFHALPVRPPTVPKGTSRIRFSLTALVEEAHIGAILDVL